MKPISFALFAFALAAAHAAHGQAVVEGKVHLPPPMPADIAPNERYPGAGEVTRGLADPPMAIVYLEGAFPARAEPKERPVLQMPQKQINFAPGLLPVQVGTTVEFPNLDDTYHNVFSYSKTKRFDLGRYRKEEKPGVVLFDKAGVVTLHCEVHEKMRGTVLVLDTPYFRKTDREGRFRLDNLPPGRYLLKAWLSESDIRSQTVELLADATLRVDFPAK